MKRMTTDEEVDAVLARQWSNAPFVSAGPPPWLPPFEQSLPFRLPPTYRSLLVRYRFPALEVGEVALFGNLDGKSRDDFVVASIRDETLASVSRANGFLQIGRPAGGSYDAICFDMRHRPKTGEAPIVCLDHEEILCNDSIRVIGTVAPSLLELIAHGCRSADSDS